MQHHQGQRTQRQNEERDEPLFTKFKELRNVARSKKTINDLTLWKSFGACMMAALMDVREAPDIALLFIPCNLLKLKALIHVGRGKRK